MLNVSVQLSAPRWVTARAISLYSSALTAGIGLGSWMWGTVAAHYDVAIAFIGSGIAVMCTALLGIILALPRDEEVDQDSVDIGYEPEVGMALTMRSGPVIVDVDYDVDPDKAREFYAVMLQLQRMRKRIGGFQWSISRDVSNPALWIESYHCPTWGDYLRMRSRYSQADLDLQTQADGYNRSGEGRRVRRRLERPYGSVRWQADSPDPHIGTMGYLGP